MEGKEQTTQEVGKVTQAKVNELKKKHGRIFKYVTEDGKEAFLKMPDRKILGYARETSSGNSMKFNEAVIENIFVAGDEEIKTNDKYFFGLSAKIDELIEIVEGELQEL